MRIFICTLVFFVSLAQSAGAQRIRFQDVCFESTCVRAEVADSEYKRYQGLMNRESLEEDQGMFFVFEKPARQAFWMLNTLIPLDIIWISKDMQVVDIVTAEPCKQSCESLVPLQEASFVLEVNAGFSARHNVKIGDKAELKKQ